jgi:hypothetical protein
MFGSSLEKPEDASSIPVAPEEKDGGMDQGSQKFGLSSRRPDRSLEARCPGVSGSWQPRDSEPRGTGCWGAVGFEPGRPGNPDAWSLGNQEVGGQ